MSLKSARSHEADVARCVVSSVAGETLRDDVIALAVGALSPDPSGHPLPPTAAGEGSSRPELQGTRAAPAACFVPYLGGTQAPGVLESWGPGRYLPRGRGRDLFLPRERWLVVMSGEGSCFGEHGALNDGNDDGRQQPTTKETAA